MKKGIFVTGTGTGVGKTLCSAILLKLLREQGIDAVPMKPVQTGGESDIKSQLELAGVASNPAELSLMNPYCYEPACSPHLAAQIAQRPIELSAISKALIELQSKHEFVIVEGAGGVLVPLDAEHSMVDLMIELELPVVVVASSQLGTINHTLLTLEALKSRGVSVLGLIITDHDSNAEDDFIANDNVALFERSAGFPVLMRVPYLAEINNSSIALLSETLRKKGIATKLIQALSSEELDLTKLRQIDHNHLWHPFTDINRFEQASDYTVIERAQGSYLFDTTGKRHLDGISSWWCVNLGHGNKTVLSALQKRSRELQQCILGDLAHTDGVLLAEELANLLPGDLNHVFYASDGSSAVEAALKIALQYWWNKGVEGKKRFIHLENSYHGDTLAAVSVGYIESFHASLKEIVWPNFSAPAPFTTNSCPQNCSVQDWLEQSFQPMEKLLREHSAEVAAVIVEPLCQAAGGMRIYHAEYLKKLRTVCDEVGVLLIADEIAVGFGRTGTMFACEQAGIAPDLMVLGKGLTSGMFPMSAVVATSEIYQTFRNDSNFPDKNRTFFHGHTYSGHPLAAACARATLKVFREEGILETISEKAKILSDGFKELSKLVPDSSSNSLGMIGMLSVPEVLGGAKFANAAAKNARSLGLFIRPLDDILYLYPPLTASKLELGQMIDILSQGINLTLR
jgi:adenosylmethionine-8-amino-7-oxononanoate aminotransferase